MNMPNQNTQARYGFSSMYLFAGAAALTAGFAYKHKMMDLAPVAECGTAFQDKNLIQVME